MKYSLELPEALAPLIEQNRHPGETPEQCIERILKDCLVEDNNLFVVQNSLYKIKTEGTEVVSPCYVCLCQEKGLYFWFDLKTVPVEVCLGTTFLVGKTKAGIRKQDLAIALEEKIDLLVYVLESPIDPSLEGFWDKEIESVLEPLVQEVY